MDNNEEQQSLSSESSDSIEFNSEDSKPVKTDNFIDSESVKAETSKMLASVLVSALSVSYLAHYVVVLILSLFDKKDTLELLSNLFNAWMPIIAGFTGAAVTHYFSKKDILK